jgi:hypothetical protein
MCAWLLAQLLKHIRSAFCTPMRMHSSLQQQLGCGACVLAARCRTVSVETVLFYSCAAHSLGATL